MKLNNMLDGIQNTLLLGPGPSGVAPSTYYALSRPTLGHLDPYFFQIMDETKRGLQILMGTENEITVPISGTGSAGMEAAFVNMIEPNDKVLILVNGVFGARMADVAERLGAQVTKLEFDWGTPVIPAEVKLQLEKDKYAIVAAVHAETSTGVRNPVEQLGSMIKDHGALYLVDCVTSLAGIPVEADKWHADILYSGTQKCLSCPPGLAPITFSKAALEKLRSRKSKVPNWYLDMSMLLSYWSGKKRIYHHTAPINMVYGLYQAVYNVLDEGPESSFRRHQTVHEYLTAQLNGLGMDLLVEKPYRLPMLNAVKVPDGVDEAVVRTRLLEEHHIEIGAGLGALAGKIFRIGLMGYNAETYVVDRLIAGMKAVVK